MTKQDLEAWAIRHGYIQDRFGHFHRANAAFGPVRLKMQKISVRSERKSSGRWFPRWTAYYSQLEITPEDKLKRLTREPSS